MQEISALNPVRLTETSEVKLNVIHPPEAAVVEIGPGSVVPEKEAINVAAVEFPS